METVLEGVRAARHGVTAPSQPEGRTGFLSDVIVELGFIDQATADWAVEQGRVVGQAVPTVLLESGVLNEGQLSRATAELHGLDHVDLEAFDVDLDVARLISKSAAQRYQAVPIAFDEDGTLLVALSDPVDPLAVDDIAVMTKSEVHPMVATQSSIDAVIDQLQDAPALAAQPEQPRIESVFGRPPENGVPAQDPFGVAAQPATPAPPAPPAPPANDGEMAHMRQALADLAARVESFTAPPAEAPAPVPEPQHAPEPPQAPEPASPEPVAYPPGAPAAEHQSILERLADAERRAQEAETALRELGEERDRERQLHQRTREELQAQLDSAKESNRRLEQRLASVMAVTAEIRAACERLVGEQPRRR